MQSKSEAVCQTDRQKTNIKLLSLVTLFNKVMVQFLHYGQNARRIRRKFRISVEKL